MNETITKDPPTTSYDDRQINELIKLDDDLLYFKIGLDLTEFSIEAKSLDVASMSLFWIKDVTNRGKEWIETKKPILEEKICSNKKIRDLVEAKPRNYLSGLFILISQILETILTTILSIALIILIIKFLINGLCFKKWEE